MSDAPGPLVEHSFRHAYGRLVATLTRTFGVARLEAVEDAVQTALARALEAWAQKGPPDDPAGWLYRVAHNEVLSALRRSGAQRRATERAAQEPDPAPSDTSSPHFEREIHDAQLRMMFVCCEPSIPLPAQLVLALKTLCGFGTAEIARSLFTSEENVRQRLARARSRLRALAGDGHALDAPEPSALPARVEMVRTTLYLLFHEGFHASQPDRAVRRELCEEAIRMATLLAQHPVGDLPATRALLALFHFHLARLDARVDGAGELLLLEEQDRARWDRAELARAVDWLARAAEGDAFSRYHAEAGIAAEHCLAPSFEATRWGEIAQLYGMLEALAPSPLHALNRAIAVGYQQGPRAGLSLLAAANPPAWLRELFLWEAALGDMHRRAGDLTQARRHLTRAVARAPTEHERALVRRRLDACGPE